MNQAPYSAHPFSLFIKQMHHM